MCCWATVVNNCAISGDGNWNLTLYYKPWICGKHELLTEAIINYSHAEPYHIHAHPEMKRCPHPVLHSTTRKQPHKVVVVFSEWDNGPAFRTQSMAVIVDLIERWGDPFDRVFRGIGPWDKVSQNIVPHVKHHCARDWDIISGRAQRWDTSLVEFTDESIDLGLDDFIDIFCRSWIGNIASCRNFQIFIARPLFRRL